MSENDISLILTKLEYFAKELQDFKVDVKDNLQSVKDDAKDKCKTCINFGLLKQEVDRDGQSLFAHIKALWLTVGTVAAALFGIFISHVLGR